MNNLLAQYNNAAEAFVSALGACHQALTHQNIQALEAARSRYKLEADALEVATRDCAPLPRLGIQALLSAQKGASKGICWHFQSRLKRLASEVAAIAGDQEGAQHLEDEADKLQAQVEALADSVFSSQDLAETIGRMMPMGQEVAA